MRILLVEDDESMVEVLTRLLAEQNYVIDVATDGESGWDLVESFPYDLVLLDVMLPKLDGISFCRRLREQKNQVLVMLLTARDDTTDKLLGLDSGADDYLVKPFNLQELIARIRALMRRGSTAASPVLTCGALTLDPDRHEVAYQGKVLQFSRKEYLLLELFLRNQQRVYSCREIVDHLWSLDAVPPDDTTVRSHIKNIRRELKKAGAEDFLETLYGQGYRINPGFITQAAPLPVSAAPTEALNVSVLQVWERTKNTSFKRLVALEQALAALKTGTLNLELCQTAIANAHKLAGSLGMFEMAQGSVIARQLETLFQASAQKLLAPNVAAQHRLALKVEPLVQALRQELEGFTGQPVVAPLASPESRSSQAQGARVLAVDDDSQVLLLLKKCLEPLGITLTCLEDATRFWETLYSTQPDLVILDINMPLMNGIDLCRAVRQDPKWNWLPILFLTARCEADVLREAFTVGADDYLTKPLVASELSVRIFNRLQRTQTLKTHAETDRIAHPAQMGDR